MIPRLFLGLALPLVIIVCRANDFDHDHQLFTEVLSQHVHEEGLFDYQAVRQDPETLNAYLDQLAGVTKAEFEDWDHDEKLAYWINAYNAYTIKTIIDHYPIEADGLSALRFPANSIRQIDGVWKEIEHRAGGRSITLDAIEHDQLRGKLDEPRIHFAVNCASIGCPELPDHAFEADRVDQQLDTAAKRFVNNPRQVRLNREEDTLHLSKIFEWFGGDFKRFDKLDGYGKYDGVVSFCLAHLPENDTRYIRRHKPDIEWIEYDWSLNEWQE